ncbi:MAG: cell division protein FtsA [Hyphomonadaceae bacterium]|nr:cell division protein FtsA [Hyphomonadaceae bacterium]
MTALLLTRRAEREPASLPALPLVAALDVGVSKTVCLATRRDPVLDLHPDRPLRVLGVGQQTAPAIASGKAADFEACARAIRVAIEEASAMAGASITRVTASYSGPGVQSRILRGAVRIRSGVIAGRDVDAVFDAALESFPSPQLTVLHIEPLRYFVDDGAPIDDPVGKAGRKLAIEACIVTAPTDAINALKACVRMAGAEVETLIAGPKAAAASALTADEFEQGALLLDIGAGSLGLSVFADGALLHAETVAVGGVRLTRDLAHKLQTTFAAAERVKLHFGSVGAACDPREAVQAPRLGFDGRLEAATTLRGVIAETLTPRFFEMMLVARDRLARAGFAGAAGPQRAVLVGGGAMMPGVRELASEALGMPVRLGRPFDLCGFDHGEAGPGYAAAAGLLRLRLDEPTLDDVEEAFQPSLANMLVTLRQATTGAWTWLRDNF